ncbi:hypothetical protein VTO58DRAFT_107598 [Aureobasidium pullulans]
MGDSPPRSRSVSPSPSWYPDETANGMSLWDTDTFKVHIGDSILQEMWNDRHNADFEIHCGTGKFKVHKAVLRAHSDVLAKACDNYSFKACRIIFQKTMEPAGERGFKTTVAKCLADELEKVNISTSHDDLIQEIPELAIRVLKENQMTHPSPGGKILVDKVRFVDFTSHSEDGLGVLARLPREIREMVYGSLGSSLHCHSLDGRCEKQTYYALRMLQNFAVMKTSKQICVEFLEAFVRKTVFVTYHEFCDCSDSHFETFLRYLNRRIRISPNIRQIGFRIDTVIHNDPEHEKFFKSVDPPDRRSLDSYGRAVQRVSSF